MARVELDFSGLDKLVSPSFYPLMFDESRYLVMKGGGGSGKSYTTAEKLIHRNCTESGHRILLIRKTFSSIRESQFKLINSVIENWGLSKYFTAYVKDLRIVNKLNGNEFLSAGMDDREKLKSILEPTIIWYEEPTELELRDFLQAELRLRGESDHYKQSILTFNPISELNWIKDYFFPPEVELQLKKKNKLTYLKEEVLDPKTGKTTKLYATVHHSTYRDNAFIDKEYIATLQAMAKADPAYGDIYMEGNWGTIGNLAYPNGFHVISRSEYPEEFEEVIYGIDFGENHPTAIIAIGVKDMKYYTWEVLYEPLKKRLKSNANMIKEMIELGIPFDSYIRCDAQNGAYIKEIEDAGFWNCKPAAKGQGSVHEGISTVKMCEMYTCPDNVNINKELVSYKLKEDANGRPREGEYVPLFDDALSAIRYVMTEYVRKAGDVNIWFM